MTLREFENGYWYREQLKDFAERIGIPSATKLRKDELERAIVGFLRTGKAALPTKRSLDRTGIRDVERGLCLKLRIENYTSNRETIALNKMQRFERSLSVATTTSSLISSPPTRRRRVRK